MVFCASKPEQQIVTADSAQIECSTANFTGQASMALVVPPTFHLLQKKILICKWSEKQKNKSSFSKLARICCKITMFCVTGVTRQPT
jgi:hypothetical protein